MGKILSLILCFVCIGPAAILGQQPAAPRQRPTTQTQQPPRTDAKPDDDTLKISATLVQVDAVVVDEKGRPVTDLKAEDFEILEDGRVQPITNFSFITVGVKPTTAESALGTAAKRSAVPVPPVPPVPLKRGQVRRTMALIVDDLNLSFESLDDVRKALKKFVDEQMQPGDLVAILRTRAGVGALQQFTTDKRLLYAAIDRVRWSLYGRGGIGAFPPVTPDRLVDKFTESGDIQKEDGGKNMDSFFAENFAAASLGALDYVIRGLSELPGRKSVIILSDGLPRRDAEGKILLRVEQALDRIIDQANRASVVLYAIDTRGLATTGITAQDDFSQAKSSLEGLKTTQTRFNALEREREGFQKLAISTGGLVVHDNNDFNHGLASIMGEQGYYLLGYMPDESTFKGKNKADQFHKLEVRVKRAGLNVRSRSGFYAARDEEVRKVTTPQGQILTALLSPFAGGEVGLQLTSLFGNEQKAGSYVRSLLHIDASNLTFRDEPAGWKKCVINVMAVTFGDNGTPIDQRAQTYGVRVRGEVYEQALRDGLIYTLDLPMKKAGAYQLRVAVRDDATGRIGSANQFIEVPDVGKGGLALSGLVLRGVDPKAAVGSAGAELKAGGEERGEAAPQGSPAVRQIKRGMQLQYGLVIYNGKVEKGANGPQLETEVVLYREGQAVFRGPASAVEVSGQKDMKRVVTWGGMQLPGSLAAGQYVLQVVVRDKGRKGKQAVAAQWIDFQYIE